MEILHNAPIIHAFNLAQKRTAKSFVRNGVHLLHVPKNGVILPKFLSIILSIISKQVVTLIVCFA